jgi:hypothetical protein
MDILHDVVPLGIIRQGAFGAEESLAWPPVRAGDQRHLDPDFLALGHARVFVEFDRLAVDSAVKRSGHDSLPGRAASIVEAEL